MKVKSITSVSVWLLLVCTAFATPAWAEAPYFRYCNVQSLNTSASTYTLIFADVRHPKGSMPSIIRSVTVEGPAGFSTLKMTSADYSTNSNLFYKYVSTSPPAGQYKFTVLDTSGKSATSYSYLEKDIFPVPLPLGTYGDMLAPTLSWSDLNINRDHLFRALVFDDRGNQVWSSDVTGETNVVMPSGVLASGKSYRWRVVAQDNNVSQSADNSSESDALLVESATRPGFLYARVYSLSLPGSSVSTVLDVRMATRNGNLPGDIASLQVTGPGGFLYTFRPADYSPTGNNYYHIIPGPPAEGMYSFQAWATQMSAWSYHCFRNATVPQVDATTMQASGDPLAPALTWAAPASDKSLYYSVAVWDAASGDKVWGVQGTVNTCAIVPAGKLPSGKTYKWQIDVQDSPSPYIPNNIARTAKVDLVVDNTKPNFLSGGSVYIRNDPDGISTSVDAHVNDPGPDGAGLTSSMSLAVNVPDGSRYEFLPADLVRSVASVPTGQPKSYEYLYSIPATLPDGTYTLILEYPVGQSRQALVTHCAMHDGGRVPMPDETTFQVTGSDPVTPTVSWSAIPGYPGNLYYRLKIVDADGAIVTNSSRGPLTSQTVPAGILQAGQSYRYRVEAMNGPPGASFDNRSDSDFFPLQFSRDTAPGAPTNVAATTGNARATVSFDPPKSDGGSPITHYTVTSIPGGKTVKGNGSPMIIKGLTNGTAYTFRVTATNKIGTGAASAPSATQVIPASVPGTPSKVTAKAGDGEAIVNFNPPANGGSPITGYTVTSKPGGITATGAGGPMTVSGLTNGTAYTFSVRATNGIGNGPWSSNSKSVTPATKPGAPTIVGVKGGNAKATVSFKAPASNGGSRITLYTVISSTGQTASGRTGPITVKGLTNGTSCTFTVTAANNIGTGPASSPSSPVTPKAP